MPFHLADFEVHDVDRLLTPALLLDSDRIQRNIRTTISMLGGDPNRWRPHVKTAKLESVMHAYVQHGVHQFKCSTTLELLTACRAGGSDVLLSMAVAGANATRVKQIARQYPAVKISVLVESERQLDPWLHSEIGIFLDLNSGMNRTGMDADQAGSIIGLASKVKDQFRGLHWYDGHISMADWRERRAAAFASYDQLIKVVDAFETAHFTIGEVITSGTPAAPLGIEYPGFQARTFIHRVSPGTVVYCDLNSLKQLPNYDYSPAAVVVATVISHPMPNIVTCDAGHKSVSVDSGVPNCEVIGHPELTPLKPSEEHLPLELAAGAQPPPIGSKLYLVPKHVCPTVNNFDDAVMISGQQIRGLQRVSARGRENPLQVEATT